MSIQKYNKIFGVGYNKTGTSTLEKILKDLNLRMPQQCEQEIELTDLTFRGYSSPLYKYVQKFDAFQDLPFSQGNTYAICDVIFPNSRFILTVRDPENWFSSLCRFHKKIWNIDNLNSLTESDIKKLPYLYNGYVYSVTKKMLTVDQGDKKIVRWDLLYDHDYYIEHYIKRNEEICSHFKFRESQFLKIDLTEEADTSKICQFLDMPKSKIVTTPHENRST